MSAALLKRIIAQVLVIDVELVPDMTDLFNANPANLDDIEQINYYLLNPNLVTEQTCADLVTEQLAKYPSQPFPSFELESIAPGDLPFTERWNTYLSKLEQCLEQVKFRSTNQYAYQNIMPPLQQILALQQECWQLTCEYYGADCGNISCFFGFYIRMCEEARITRYKYAEITKYLSADKFIAYINLEQRKQFIQQHELEVLQPYNNFGGISARGRTAIDATSISNVCYYKQALQYLYFFAAQKTIVELWQSIFGVALEDYGQVPVDKKQLLWQLIQEHFSADSDLDRASIFYQFAVFCNIMPGACFTKIPEGIQVPEAMTPQELHKIIKYAGIKSGKLCLLDRTHTEDWTPKRYMVASWQRKYPLLHLRPAGKIEHMRIVPNEMPYATMHGMSLCGDGLREGLEYHDNWQYSWNLPIDSREEVNNAARDIEKLFRELKMVSPHPASKLLPGENLFNIFQNTVAYSTQVSQHTHITQGTLETYNIYMMPAKLTRFIEELQAEISLVQVGNNPDAMFVRVIFDELENEPVIQFLLELYHATYDHFFGSDHIDSFIQIFSTRDAKFAFIFEPHVLLTIRDNTDFINSDTNEVSIRKPFWFIPQGENIQPFAADNPLATGLPFLRKFYDSTCKQGVYAFIEQYISRLP